MQAKSARELVPEPHDDDDEEDIDAFRNRLALRLRRIVSNKLERWRGCDQRVCKRAKTCCAPQAVCAIRHRAQQTVDPQQQARAMARLYRMIRERVEQDEAEEKAAENAAAAAAKSLKNRDLTGQKNVLGTGKKSSR